MLAWIEGRVWRRFSLYYRNKQFKQTLQRHSSHDRKHVLVKIQLRVWLLITNPIKLQDFHYNFVVSAPNKVLANMHA